MKTTSKLEGLTKRVAAILKRHHYEVSYTDTYDLKIGKGLVSAKEKQGVWALVLIFLAFAFVWWVITGGYLLGMISIFIGLSYGLTMWSRFRKKVNTGFEEILITQKGLTLQEKEGNTKVIEEETIEEIYLDFIENRRPTVGRLLFKGTGFEDLEILRLFDEDKKGLEEDLFKISEYLQERFYDDID